MYKIIDNFINDTDRIAITFYLNDEWNPNSGGELILYNNKNEPKDIILPKGNRLCIVYDELHKVSVNLNKYIDRLSIQTFTRSKMEIK
jgi:Rps23 Pro-64 3,4-dihydroxylase Tpa1-like proline 4-hydroxylase